MAEVILQDRASIEDYGPIPLQFWPVRAFIGFWGGLAVSATSLTVIVYPLIAAGLSDVLIIYSSLFAITVVCFASTLYAGYSKQNYEAITHEEAIERGLVEDPSIKQKAAAEQAAAEKAAAEAAAAAAEQASKLEVA